VYLPSAFSPNGDGQNDVLELFTACRLTEVEASVFDRWGNLLFRGRTTEQLWDGTIRGEVVPEAVYVMMVNYQLLSDSGGEQRGTVAGEIFLIR